VSFLGVGYEEKFSFQVDLFRSCFTDRFVFADIDSTVVLFIALTTPG
jgi:hypothetical protein